MHPLKKFGYKIVGIFIVGIIIYAVLSRLGEKWTALQWMGVFMLLITIVGVILWYRSTRNGQWIIMVRKKS